MDVYVATFEPQLSSLEFIGAFSRHDEAKMVIEGLLSEEEVAIVSDWEFNSDTCATWWIDVGGDSYSIDHMIMRTL